ncbi:MAG: DNA mismatch repair protein MutL, partial [Oscillospiraceae bacterium]
TVLENLPLLAKTGFIVEDFGDTAVILRSVPAVAEAERAKEMFLDITAGLMQNKKADFPSLVEDILHRIACRAAVKANDQNSMAELSELVHVIYTDENVRYCPHGRPVMICYTKKEMEKMFGRIM